MYEKREDRRRQGRRLAVVVLTVVAAVLAGGSISGFARARAAEEDVYKCYDSIRIENGDTLWSIAVKHRNPDYDRIEEYIREVRRLNHICGDRLYAGEYLTIPCYLE